MLKSDLHLHTNKDPDDGKRIKYSPKDIIRIAQKCGFEVLSLTHHEKVFYNKDIVSFAEKHNILLIPGVEAMVEGKHVVVLNYRGKPIETFEQLEKAKDEDILIMAPHPFFKLSPCLGNMLYEKRHLFDAIEYSHFYTSYFNLNNKAVRFAEKYKLPLIGTSDAHELYQFNKTFSIVHSDKKIDSVIEALCKGKLDIETEPLDLIGFIRVLLWDLTAKFTNPKKHL
jgi:predicted metal-dependent phosphoesterase TrpH